MRIAFFDMDRTILSENSGKSWIRFQFKRGELSIPFMAKATYWQILYRLALLDMETLATRLVRDYKDHPEQEMLETCAQWFEDDLAALVSPGAVAQIRAHQEAGDRVVMITGASQYAAEPVANLVGIEDVLCSRLEVVDGLLTGQLATMCFGTHKVGLAQRIAKQSDIELKDCAFYTDSYNDLPLLEEVGECVVVNADARLLRCAKKRGWRVETWAS